MSLWVSIMLGAALVAPGAPNAVQRLSAAQVEQVLAEAARKREAVEQAAPGPKRVIQGEVGVEVGTGGYRSVYGHALVPLGADGGALLSVSGDTESGHGSDRRRRAPR